MSRYFLDARRLDLLKLILYHGRVERQVGKLQFRDRVPLAGLPITILQQLRVGADNINLICEHELHVGRVHR